MKEKYMVVLEYLKAHWENRMLIFDRDPIGIRLSELDPSVVFVPFNPTAEGIAEFIVIVLGTSLLRETNYTITKCTVQQGLHFSATYTIL
jgi:6-pyruvoyltetrahydropterin/6-carboxytetrahydropterin synthase